MQKLICTVFVLRDLWWERWHGDMFSCEYFCFLHSVLFEEYSISSSSTPCCYWKEKRANLGNHKKQWSFLKSDKKSTLMDKILRSTLSLTINASLVGVSSIECSMESSDRLRNSPKLFQWNLVQVHIINCQSSFVSIRYLLYKFYLIWNSSKILKNIWKLGSVHIDKLYNLSNTYTRCVVDRAS